jgi:sugar phosphate permease
MAGIAALAIGYVLSQFYRSFMAVLTPILTIEIGMTKAELSIASGAWFIAFALAQFAIGVSLDRWGPKRTASILLGVCGGGGALLFSMAVEPWMVICAMALIGLGCAPVLMSILVIFAHNYPPARFAVLASWAVAFGTAGNVIGASPLANAAEAFGWRFVLVVLACFTVMTALAVYALVRDPPRHHESSGSGFSGYVELFRLRVLWPIIPLTALNYAPASGIRGLWAGPYLSDVYGADVILIGQVTFFMALAMVAGSFLYGPLDVIFKTRKWVAVVGNTASLLVLAYLAFVPVPGIFETAAALVVIGVAGGSYALLMAHARAFVPRHLTGRGVTLMNFFSIGGVGIMQFMTGGVVTASTTPDNPATAYTALFLFYLVTLGFALAIYLAARDAKPEQA